MSASGGLFRNVDDRDAPPVPRWVAARQPTRRRMAPSLLDPPRRLAHAPAMPDDLYDRDILLWSEREAALLRRLAAGERVNHAVDWGHVIEELAGVGLSELRGVQSLLQQALLHLIEIHAEPHAPAAPHWLGEIDLFLGNARERCTAAMRQRVDLEKQWRLVLRPAQRAFPTVALPLDCPWTLDEVLAEAADPAALAVRLASLKAE